MEKCRIPEFMANEAKHDFLDGFSLRYICLTNDPITRLIELSQHKYHNL